MNKYNLLKIKHLCNIEKIKLYQVAKIVNIDPSKLSAFLNNRMAINEHTLYKIIEAINTIKGSEILTINDILIKEPEQPQKNIDDDAIRAKILQIETQLKELKQLLYI